MTVTVGFVIKTVTDGLMVGTTSGLFMLPKAFCFFTPTPVSTLLFSDLLLLLLSHKVALRSLTFVSAASEL